MHNNNTHHELNPDVLFSILEMIGVGSVCLIVGIVFERMNYMRCCRRSTISVV